MSKLEDKELSTGKQIDGTIWTPLYTAYYFNCPDIGRALVRRHADVNMGGRQGGLLAEISTQRALNPDPKNSNINTAWAAIVELGVIDVDAPTTSGLSNRQIWSEPTAVLGDHYPNLWDRFLRRSIATPLRPEGAEADPDAPTSATGKTRPAESPVSKGVEKFFQIHPKSGMAGLSVEVAGCYKWALQISKPSGRRIALENCAALDLISKDIDVQFASKNGFPRTPFFEDAAVEQRVNQIRDQNFDGMVWPLYRDNLEASAKSWFSYHLEVYEGRSASLNGNTAPSPVARSPSSKSDSQIKSLATFVGHCRYQLVSGFFDCNPKVTFIEFRSGRSVLVFQSGDATFTLSGGRDRQPNLEDYFLGIDRLRLDRTGLSPAEDDGMEGECHFSLSRDASKFYSIKCDVYNRLKGTKYNFYLEDIRQVDRR